MSVEEVEKTERTRRSGWPSGPAADAVEALREHFTPAIQELVPPRCSTRSRLPRHRRHLLFALVDSGVAFSAVQRLGLDAPALDLLRWAFNEQVSPYFTGVFRKLGPKPLRVGTYAALNETLWKQRRLGRALLYLSHITPEAALALPSRSTTRTFFPRCLLDRRLAGSQPIQNDYRGGGRPGEDRTHDHSIKSRMLYH